MRPPIDSFAVSKLGGTVECVMGGQRESRQKDSSGQVGGSSATVDTVGGGGSETARLIKLHPSGGNGPAPVLARTRCSSHVAHTLRTHPRKTTDT